MLTLGIDAGGTYTDAILLDQDSGEVRASAKALTTYHDLSLGVGEAISRVMAAHGISAAEITLVSLSTTLATNAIVEGVGSPVCLLLIGYDAQLMHQYDFERDLVTGDVVYIQGGHDGQGDELAPLDEDAVREVVRARRGKVEAFAVSAYFSVRNPAHELRARQIIEDLTGEDGQPLPVTCGHELTTRLNAVRRATTTALNARLIPLLRDLILTVRRTLDALDIGAPLMIVRGDGSLVRSEWATRRPIETILSGPAASTIGAWHLAGRRDGWVVDIGGTTTDIAFLRDGRPWLNEQGAQVGRWRTMVEAVDVHTVGLGGDSLVSLDGSTSAFTIGPRRVVPLCVLANEHPDVLHSLQNGQGALPRQGGQFLYALRERADGLDEEASGLLRYLSQQPRSLADLADAYRYLALVNRKLEALEARRLVARAGFTPTDALHVLGRFTRWDERASRLGADLLAGALSLPVEAFCEQVVAGVSMRAAGELVSKALTDQIGVADWTHEPAAAALLALSLGQASDSYLGVSMTLHHPIVAVGASAQAYLPQAADRLHVEMAIPPNADVANAVGAAVGSVSQTLRVLVRPLNAGQNMRLYLPDDVRDFRTLDECTAFAQEVVPDQLREQARQAGTEQVEIHVTRDDQYAHVAAGWGEQLYLGTEMTFTAVGRPSQGRRSN